MQPRDSIFAALDDLECKSADLEALLSAIDQIGQDGCLMLPEKGSAMWNSIRSLWTLIHVCQDLSGDMTKSLGEVHIAVRALRDDQGLVEARL